MMLIPNNSPNSFGDKMHAQETVIYSLVYFLCVPKYDSWTLPNCEISEKWTNRALRKWGLKLGVGGWGVIWVDAGWINGILNEHAVFVGLSNSY